MDEILNFTQGDPKAEKAIYELYAGQLLLFAFRYTKEKMVAEEIVDDSFEKLFKILSNFNNEKTIKAFLYLTTRNACIDHLRGAKRENKDLNEYKYHIEDAVEDENALNVEQRYSEAITFLIKAIEKQPPQRKQVLEYLYKYNLKPKEIAARMNIHVSGVYGHKDEFIRLMSDVKGVEGKILSRLLHRS